MICEKLMNYQTSLFQVEVPENDKKETRFNIAEVGSAGESGPSSPTSPSSPRYRHSYKLIISWVYMTNL